MATYRVREMLKQTKDGTIVDLMPKIETTKRNLLEWRTPTDHPCDMDGSITVANGFGGRYSVQADADKFVLWMDDGEFVFATFETVEKCKRYAECRFEKQVRKLYARLKG